MSVGVSKHRDPAGISIFVFFPSNLQFQFEVIRGSNWESDIGLDDVKISPGVCGMLCIHSVKSGHRGRDRMVVGLTTTYAISAYHH